MFLHANDLEMDREWIRAGARVSFEVEDGPAVSSRRVCNVTATRPAIPNPVPAVARRRTTTTTICPQEFKQTVTEMFLEIPAITGEQIRQVRAAF